MRKVTVAQLGRKPSFYIKKGLPFRVVRHIRHSERQETLAYVVGKEMFRYKCEHCGDPVSDVIKFKDNKTSESVRIVLCEECKKLLL